MRLSHACFMLALAAPPALGAQSTVRSYAVPGHGSLELEVPMRWREEIGWTEGDHRPRIRFRPDEGEAFLMTIAVLPPPADAPPDFGTAAWLKGVVEDSARRSLGVEDEQALGLEQIGDTGAVGWYFSVTDPAVADPPPPGTFRVMTQGASSAGGLVLTSTILTQRRWGPELNDALLMLRTAKVSDREPDAWRAPGEIVQARGALGQRYDLAVPEDFELLSSGPLEIRDRITGGVFTVNVERGTSSVKDELRRLEREADLRSPGQWLTRKRGPAQLAGKPAARLALTDELHDEARVEYAVPLDDAVLTAAWRVHPTRERMGAQRLQLLLDALVIR